MYKTKTISDFLGNHVEYIFIDTPQGGIMSFANIESNDSSERQAYLKWLEEGNTPESAEEN